MHWNQTTNLNRKALRRIVVMLLAFACLAERASMRSSPIRWRVLWILRLGEFVARRHVAAVTREARFADPLASLAIADGDGWDATGLARIFRALAALLAGFLDRIAEAFRADPALGCSAGRAAFVVSHPDWLAAVEFRDTS